MARHVVVVLAAVTALSLGTAAPARAESGSASTRTWTFDADNRESQPAGFQFARTGFGRPGRWVARAESDAPSGPNVLAQVDTDVTSYRFLVAVVAASSLRDLDLSVKCKPVSGTIDQACGLVFRYLDENNYYVARANALEGNIRLYYVKDGKRIQVASANGRVTAHTWHDLRVKAKADHIEVFWEGRKVLSADDDTFRDAGKVGVWTKADSVTYFDDLTLEPLNP